MSFDDKQRVVWLLVPFRQGMREMKVIGIPDDQPLSRKNTWLLIFLASVGLWAMACGRSALAYEEELVKEGGSIAGMVKFSGTVPSPNTYKVNMGSNPEFCRTIADEKGMISIPQVRISSTHQIADVVVFLQEVERGKPMAKQNPVVAIDRCRFEPQVIGAIADQTLQFIMRDPILHQLRGWEILEQGRLPLFHLPDLGEGGEAQVPLNTRRSSIVKLECDQHRFMQGWLLLTANPYVTVTDVHGTFQLKDVPAGTHTVGAWHPELGYQEARVTVRPGQENLLELTLTSSFQP